MAEEKIRIILAGDAKSVVNAAGQAETAIGRLGKIIGGLAIGGGVLMLAKKGFDILSDAIKGTIGFIQSSIDAAAQEQLQLKKLEQALISTGNYTKAGYKELVEYANSLQKVTRYADEDIVALEAQLSMFKLSNEEIKIATQATLDLAAAKDMDLQAASVLIGKVMVGEMGMLKRYGIVLDENIIKTGDWKAALEQITIAFGGQARAQAETYLGSMDRLKNMFGDIKEEIGNAFIPTITKLVEWFIKGKEIIDPLTGSVTNLASPFEKLKDWVHDATEAFSKYLELNWDNIIGFAEGVFDKISKFITIIKEADYSKIAEGFDDIKIALGGVIGDEETGVEGATNGYQLFIDKIGESMTALAKAISIIDAIWTTATGIIESMLTAADFVTGGIDWKTFEIMMGEIGEKMISGWEKASGQMEQISSNTTDEVKEDLQSVSTKAIEIGGMVYPTIQITSTAEKEQKKVIDLQGIIYSLKGKDIDINVNFKGNAVGKIEGSSVGKGGSLSGAPYFFQSGGNVRDNIFAPDLNIPLFKGEAVLPSELVRAIKENRGSFAGVNANRSSSIENNYYISSLVVREEADVERIAQDLFSMQKISLAGVGIR